MFGLFGKKDEQSLKERISECQKKKDWDRLARTYYDLGVDAMNKGELNKAVMWLSRADTVYSASDETYEHVGKNRLFHKEIVSDCSDRIGALEDESLLYNDVPADVDEKAEEMGDLQVRVWGLLSLARLVHLGDRLGSFPGCEVLGKLGWAVDTVLKSFKGELTEDEFNALKDLSGELYDFGDSEEFWGAGNEITVEGGEPFQVFDLNGMMGVHLNIDEYISGHLDMMSILSQDEPLPPPETGIISCALLLDYYVRTGTDKVEDVPQVKAELKRIESDREFVCSDLTWEKVRERVEEYKALDILKL